MHHYADALWMGVPVLTISESMASRQAAAVRGAGCEQWICSDQREMVEQARTLANDHDRLKKQRLRQRKQVAKVSPTTGLAEPIR